MPKQVKNNLKRFNKLDKHLSESIVKRKRSMRREMTFDEALKSPVKNRLENMALVHYDKSNIHLLLNFLQESLDKNDFQTDPDMRRLIRIYDFVRHK